MRRRRIIADLDIFSDGLPPWINLQGQSHLFLYLITMV
jgi:hypothetical protein